MLLQYAQRPPPSLPTTTAAAAAAAHPRPAPVPTPPAAAGGRGEQQPTRPFTPPQLPASLPTLQQLQSTLPAVLLRNLGNTRARYSKILDVASGSWRKELQALKALVTSHEPNLIRVKIGYRSPVQPGYWRRLAGCIHRWLGFVCHANSLQDQLSVHSYIKHIHTFFLFLTFLQVRGVNGKLEYTSPHKQMRYCSWCAGPTRRHLHTTCLML